MRLSGNLLRTLLTLVIGIAIGVTATSYYVARRVDGIMTSGPAGVRELMVGRLRSELKLSESQEQVLRAAIENAQRRFATLRAERRPEFEAILQQAVDEVKPALNNAQIQKLDKFRQSFVNRATEIERPAGAR